jgi:hypothetical protein
MSINMFNPANYAAPSDVLADKTLSNQQKIAALKDWARDEYQKGLADSENMLPARNGEYKNLLPDILNALLTLNVEFDPNG